MIYQRQIEMKISTILSIQNLKHNEGLFKFMKRKWIIYFHFFFNLIILSVFSNTYLKRDQLKQQIFAFTNDLDL